MKSILAKILFILMLALPAFYLSCERVEPGAVTGEAHEYVSEKSKNIINLRNDEFNLLGIVEGQYVFERLGNADLPVVGDLFFYNNNENCILGRIEAINLDGSVLTLDISGLSLNEFFK